MAITACMIASAIPSYAIEKNNSDNIIGENEENLIPAYVGTMISHSWSYKILPGNTKTEGNWKLIYSGHPARRDGEYDSISHSVAYSHTYSGTLEAELKGKISASLGYSFGKQQSFQVTKNSSPLKKGEYVKAYYIKNYLVNKIEQKDLMHIYGWESGWGGQYHPVDRYETKYVYAQGKKAIQPKIRLEYYKSRTRFSSDSSEKPFKVEYYENIGDNYTLVKTDVR